MSELWLNSPQGYPYAERIEKNDETNILRFCIMICNGDKDADEMIRKANHQERIAWLEASNFTFDTEWFGNRPLPERSDGVTLSALDDPAYRAKLGMIDRPPM